MATFPQYDIFDRPVRIPKWMWRFVNPRTRTVEFGYPFRELFNRIWFFIPKVIHEYNMKNCTREIPDWNGGTGTKVRPFLGMYIMVWNNAGVEYRWWKLIKRYKIDPEMVRIQKQIDDEQKTFHN